MMRETEELMMKTGAAGLDCLRLVRGGWRACSSSPFPVARGDALEAPRCPRHGVAQSWHASGRGRCRLTGRGGGTAALGHVRLQGGQPAGAAGGLRALVLAARLGTRASARRETRAVQRPPSPSAWRGGARASPPTQGDGVAWRCHADPRGRGGGAGDARLPERADAGGGQPVAAAVGGVPGGGGGGAELAVRRGARGRGGHRLPGHGGAVGAPGDGLHRGLGQRLRRRQRLARRAGAAPARGARGGAAVRCGALRARHERHQDRPPLRRLRPP
eukprot:scaffold2323_cov329-Prasinococcus_capsulatus_cf.AAC.9